MNNKNKITIGVLIFVIGLMLISGLTYAYFSANVSGGEESTTITVTGGLMNIIYNGGDRITVDNIIPKETPFATKTFTVTGINTTDLEMYYKLNFVIEKNTFSEQAIKYKLISINMDNNGSVIPSITELTNIGQGPKSVSLGIGNFISPTGGNKVHTYNLELYFPETNTNQNIDQGKEFNAYISINQANKPLLSDLILEQGGGVSAVVARGTPDFDTLDGNGIYASEDEYGTSYYYRGEKELLNNNLIWAGFQWKIIRINGDGSTRIIYNGTAEDFNTNKKVNSTGEGTHIMSSPWNQTYTNDLKYSGYMYGGANGVASTMRDGLTSAAATYNETSTAIKTTLDNWYKVNIIDNGYSNIVVDNIFCNDRQLQNEVGGPESGPGYGNFIEPTYYAALYRLNNNKLPTLKCGFKNDKFTVSNTNLGNTNLIYPVGMLSADEASFAGLKYNTINDLNYLYTNSTYWTFTPSHKNSGGSTRVFHISPSGSLYSNGVDFSHGIRPVISISHKVSVTGTGSSSDPFRI